MHGGRLDQSVPRVTAPYDDLLGSLGAKSGTFAALPANGTVDVTDTAITLTGDGVTPDLQVFTVDAATLGPPRRRAATASGTPTPTPPPTPAPTPSPSPAARCSCSACPAGATVIVNLTGPAVDLDIDSLLAPDGTVIDPLADRPSRTSPPT